MQGNENNEQAAITDIAEKLKSQPIPTGAFLPAFTHPIEYFRLQCLNMANSEDSLRKTPEQMVKDAQIFADFIFKQSGGITAKNQLFTVGEKGAEMLLSNESPVAEAPTIPSAEQRLHTLQRLFDDIDPNPNSMCNLEAAHYKMTMRLLLASKNLKEANEAMATLQEEIDNLMLDILQQGNADFLLKQVQTLPVRDQWRVDFKRKRLWKRMSKTA